ncbi:MAG: hypothetical protein GXY83_29010 [Rhodopirellula sp.]|nr:hypothetical protein [Rhodopirellula sp.]
MIEKALDPRNQLRLLSDCSLDPMVHIFFVCSISAWLIASAAAAGRVERPSQPLKAGVRVVVSAVREAAAENHVAADRLRGDRLTEYLVRRAAAAANNLREEDAAKAFLIGLGAAIDHSTVLRAAPLINQVFLAAETEDERRQRLAMLGAPTMHGRRDLAQHFVVSGALAILIGPETAETMGTIKELRDSQGGSGFSFADLAADMAGIAFANHVREKKVSLESLAESFTVASFVPKPRNLPEGIPSEAFLERFGSIGDERFTELQSEIRRQIRALPGYCSGLPEKKHARQ